MTTDQRPRILIVDDAPINLLVLNEVLAPEYQVEEAADGLQALQRAFADPQPDLILLDIMMPKMDGYEVCRRLKAAVKTREIPVIFVTGRSEEADEEKGLRIGAVDYIVKPFRPAIVRARVQVRLKLKTAREALAERNNELENMLRLRETMDQIARHDIKSPLNAMLAVTQILMMGGDLSPTQRELLTTQRRAGHKMLEMINRSLCMFRMELGDYQLEPAAVDLLGVAREVAEEAGHANLVLSLDGESPAPHQRFWVRAEELLCYSMLSNLVKNAVEASEPHQQIRIAMESGEPALLRISNPTPVPAPVRQGFFEKFVTAGKRDGSGLGAYSAKLIAITLGGEIEMRTAEGFGTEIKVSLPASAGAEAPPPGQRGVSHWSNGPSAGA